MFRLAGSFNLDARLRLPINYSSEEANRALS
ncbi:hypothetical protein RUA4292_01148 [Ruegeria atlantica]|uniref:Uncharacterized protein n=1 Tax=Ruegeria atlantica TaxID=81569 RepID=A0A0P1EBT5_9RHOB|nr:hypothetical protein RUA4292_01148 [Ruegeria atlantica]